MDKENTDFGMLLRLQKKKKKKKDYLAIATTWLGLQDIILSGIRQTQKDKFCKLSHAESSQVR